MTKISFFDTLIIFYGCIGHDFGLVLRKIRWIVKIANLQGGYKCTRQFFANCKYVINKGIAAASSSRYYRKGSPDGITTNWGRIRWRDRQSPIGDKALETGSLQFSHEAWTNVVFYSIIEISARAPNWRTKDSKANLKFTSSYFSKTRCMQIAT